IDGAWRVSERTNGNVIDAGSSDAPDCSQINPTTGFEFHLVLTTERDRFPHFGGFNVVEQNDVDALNLHERAHLLEVVCLHFNLHRWVLRSGAPNRGGEFFEILLRR